MNASEKILADFDAIFDVVQSAFENRDTCDHCGKLTSADDLYSWDWSAETPQKYCDECLSLPFKKEDKENE